MLVLSLLWSFVWFWGAMQAKAYCNVCAPGDDSICSDEGPLSVGICVADVGGTPYCALPTNDCNALITSCSSSADCAEDEACFTVGGTCPSGDFCLPVCDAGTATTTSVTTSVPTSIPTSQPTTATPTAVLTSILTSQPTTATPSSVPTSIPTSQPTTSTPSAVPTSAPTAGEAQHIVLHLYDTHGDGWADNLYLQVAHGEGIDRYALHCACKVERIFNGDITVSMWRNRTMPGPKGEVVPYEWEALWTIGYSDGVTETSFGIYGDVDTEVVIGDYEVIRVRDAVDVDVNKPSNMCVVPKPRPKPSPDDSITDSDSSESNNSTSSSDDDNEPAGPSPTVDVRLALFTSDGGSWCDDSGASATFACTKDHHLSTDATLPNLLTYPRYVISRTDDNRVVASGTLRTAASEWVTSVELLREGSYVFSVSGTYGGDAISWDFCGEQGGIGERLHFNMLRSVCRAHYIEEVDSELSCESEELNGVMLTDEIEQLKASSSLQYLRSSIASLSFVSAAFVVVALAVVAVRMRKNNKDKGEFSRVDTTVHA